MRNTLRAFCSFCQRERTFERRALDHYFHGVVSILTVGLWTIGWLVLFLHQSRKPLRCRCCRHRLRVAGEVPGASDYAAYATVAESREPERDDEEANATHTAPRE